MRRTLILLAALAACGKVSHPGGGGDGDGGAGGDGGSEPDANPITDLTVTLDVGSGGGGVTSDVGDIDCGSSCQATLDTGTEITFTATPEEGSSFVAWRGAGRDCRRATECTITLTGGPQEVGALFAEKGTAGWALQVGSTVGDSGGQFAIDKNGDLLFAAQYSGQFDFGGESYENQGEGDIFLAKLSPGGEVIWAKTLSGAASESVAFLAADPSTGDVVLGGFYTGPVDFGGPEPLAIADSEDLFVVKLSGDDGSYIWQKPIEVSDDDGPGFEGMAIDGTTGDVVVTGHFYSSINLGSTTLTSVGQEMFLARLHGEDGSVDWQRKLGGPDTGTFPNQMVVDGNGNPIMIGTFSSTVDFDGAAGNDMTPVGQRDAFVAKFVAGSGALTWQRQFGGADDSVGGNDEGYGIALAPNNTVVVVIQYKVNTSEAVTFLGQNLAGSGTGVDLVVGKISSSGGFVWAKRYGGAGNEYGYRAATFQDGRVAVSGSFTASFDMNGHAVTFEGATGDQFYGVLAAANGNATFAGRVGSPLLEYGFDWVAGYDDQLYGGGGFQGEGSFFGKTLTSAGSSDAYGFVVSLP